MCWPLFPLPNVCTPAPARVLSRLTLGGLWAKPRSPPATATAAANASSNSSRPRALQPPWQTLVFTWEHIVVSGAWSRYQGTGWLRKVGAEEVWVMGAALLSPCSGHALDLCPRRGHWVVGGTHPDRPRPGVLCTAAPLLHDAALVTMH